MSGALEKLTEAVEGLSKKMDENAALLKQALGTKATEAPKAATTTTKASGGKSGSAKGGAKKKTVDDVRHAYGEYLNNGPGGKEARPDRIAKIKAINTHFGIKSLESLDSDNIEEALGYLKQIEAGDELDFMNEDAAAGEEESPI